MLIHSLGAYFGSQSRASRLVCECTGDRQAAARLGLTLEDHRIRGVSWDAATRFVGSVGQWGSGSLLSDLSYLS